MSTAPSGAAGRARVLTLRANGLDHRLLEWTPPSGVAAGTALLLHGYMDAGATWAPVAVRLAAAGLRVLAPDLRGFGEAPRAPVGSYYHFADYVADVAAIAEALDRPAPLLLVGHSMGGTVATLYAGAFPERAAKVALLEGLGPPTPDLASMPDRLRRWIDTAVLTPPREGRAVGTLEDAFVRLHANHPKVPEGVLRTKLGPLTRDLGDGRVAWRADALHRTQSPVPFLTAGFLACARRIPVPVLYVSGGPDGFHVTDEEERLSAFAKLTRVTLPTAGHMMHWTEPDALCDSLLSFWAARD